MVKIYDTGEDGGVIPPVSKPRDSETVQVILKLGKILDIVHSAVNDLEKKLSPVLRALPTKTETKGKPKEEAFNTQLANNIDSKVEMARKILEHLESLKIRLEV